MELRARSDGVSFRVKVKPRSRRLGLLGARAGCLVVGVSAPPEKGRANWAVIDLLAEALELSRSRVEILSGHGHPEKIILCRGVSVDEVRRRLAERL